MSYKAQNGVLKQQPSILPQIKGRAEIDYWNKKSDLTCDFVFNKTNRNPNHIHEGDSVTVLEAGFGKSFIVGEVFVAVNLVDGRAYREDGKCLPLSCLKKVNGIQKVEKTRAGQDRSAQGVGSQVVRDSIVNECSGQELDSNSPLLQD